MWGTFAWGFIGLLMIAGAMNWFTSGYRKELDARARLGDQDARDTLDALEERGG